MKRMKRVYAIVVLLLALTITADSQSLQRLMIGKTGVTISAYCKMSFDMARSQDSSTVYNGECMNNGTNYGVICVKLLNPRTDMNDASQLVAAYLDYLQTSFNITHAEGYQKDLRLNKNENTRGISDTWSDAENHKWMVRGWTNGKFLVVMYTNSKGQLAASKVDPFLNGVVFPK